MFAITAFVTLVCVASVCGESCRRTDAFGREEQYTCPRLFESRKKAYCCGATSGERYCCEWSARGGELTLVGRRLFEGALAVVVVVLLVVVALVVGCCVCACCLLSRARRHRSHALSPTATTSTTAYAMAPYPTGGAAYVTTEPPPQYAPMGAPPPFNPTYPSFK